LNAFLAAGNDLPDFWKFGSQSREFLDSVPGGDKHDVVDVRTIVERGKTVRDKRPAANRSQKFVKPHSAA
jgi:hypothetical protein